MPAGRGPSLAEAPHKFLSVASGERWSTIHQGDFLNQIKRKQDQIEIECQAVQVGFPGLLLLRSVSFTVLQGESLVLVGPSGHGKSTLLKTLSGLQKPLSGQVLHQGEDLYQIQEKERNRKMQNMGMLFQKNALFDSLTCLENIAFPLREVTNLAEAELMSRASEFLEAVGLSHARDLMPNEISGGMQKRLGIARALALHPQLIFYDDPTAGLDPITSRKIIDLILSLREKHQSTLITVTNDMHRAYQLADRLGFVCDGELVVTGDESQTKNHSDPRVQQFINGGLKGPLTEKAQQ